LNTSPNHVVLADVESAWWIANRESVRATAWLGAALFCGYGFIDYLVSSASLMQTLPLRLVAASICVLFALSTKWDSFARWATGMAAALALVGTAVVAVVFFVVHERVDLGVLAVFQVMLVMMTLLPVRAAVRTTGVAVLVAANGGLAFNAVEQGDWYIYNGVLLAAVVIMLVVSEQAHSAYGRTLELEARLRREALTDGLTNIMNRRAFFDMAEKAWMGCTRTKRPLCVLLLDVDNFKSVNDAHGHAVGDDLLRRLAVVLTQELRGADLLCRYGGEEFAVLLPETTRESGLGVAERLRAAVRTMAVQTSTGSVGCAVSIGLAALEGEPVSLDHLLSEADTALYKAKREGRDRVVG
jgi:diguanylate cyclase (GGDEF)-like protein